MRGFYLAQIFFIQPCLINRQCPIDGEMAGFDALIIRLFDYSKPASFFFRGTILYFSMPFFSIQNVLPVFGGGM